MTQDEKKQIWESMSKAEQEAANEEYREMIQRQMAEHIMVAEKLKEEGKWIGGLDGKHPEIIALYEKDREELSQLLKKYGLK